MHKEIMHMATTAMLKVNGRKMLFQSIFQSHLLFRDWICKNKIIALCRRHKLKGKSKYEKYMKLFLFSQTMEGQRN